MNTNNNMSSDITPVPITEESLRGFESPELPAQDCLPHRPETPGLISVIMPVYNMEKSMKKAIDSILAQTYTQWELIIVDDGSTDGSGALADSYMERDARILTIHQPNGGVGAARNAAFPYTNGEWLAFLDADDEYLPECFEQMIRASRGADLVACGIYVDLFRVMCTPYYNIKSFDGLPEGRDLRLFWANYILLVVWGKIYRRFAVRELFATDVTYGEDTLFNFKVFPKLGRIVVIPELGYIYHMDRERMDHDMLKGSRCMLESAAAWLPDNTTILRLCYIAYIRSLRRFALSILDSDTLPPKEKAEELAFCLHMIQLPPELDHEEFLFPENLEWWRLLKQGNLEQAVAGQRIIREEGKKRMDSLYPDGFTYAPRELKD